MSNQSATTKRNKPYLKARLRLHFDKAIALGPGKADLLMAIERTGSIVAAAKQMKMSYRRAWLLVETMNQCFQGPLVETTKGGKDGGGAHLSELGQQVLNLYRQITDQLSDNQEMKTLQALLAKTPPKDPH